jgi:hypothetical protein
MTKPLGARDLSPLSRLLTTENFAKTFNPDVKTADLWQSESSWVKAFLPFSKTYEVYVGFIFKNSK